MKHNVIGSCLLRYIFLAAAFLLASANARAQAPPGPIQGPPSRDPVQTVTTPKAKTPHAPRQPHDFSGAWKLNHDESDDPRRKMEEERENRRRASGGGYGGRSGGGIGFPGRGGPYGGRRGGDSEDDLLRLRPVFNPAENLTIAQKQSQVDFTDDQGTRQTYFTDGRKVDKSKDPKNTQTAAKWEDTRLVSEEKLSNGRKLIRTYELSPEGDQLYATLRIDEGRSGYPTSVRYVYDVMPQAKP